MLALAHLPVQLVSVVEPRGEDLELDRHRDDGVLQRGDRGLERADRIRAYVAEDTR